MFWQGTKSSITQVVQSSFVSHNISSFNRVYLVHASPSTKFHSPHTQRRKEASQLVLFGFFASFSFGMLFTDNKPIISQNNKTIL